MNRTNYFNYIEEKLNTLAYRIKQRGKINILDLNIHSETFFAELCNLIFNLNLRNLNSIIQNTEGIDLIDDINKVVVQVSSICTKSKIESSLDKSIYKKYCNYQYKFISICREATNTLKKENFKNPYNMKFNPLEDIWDISTILRNILNKNIETQRILFNFIKAELGQDIDTIRLDSNLAKIINILAEEKFDINAKSPESIPFAIEDKIEFNNLSEIKDIIDDYKIFYHKVDEKYSEFDKEGKNKSFSVLQEIRKQYIKAKSTNKSPEEIFFEIVDNTINIVTNSRNYIEIPIEELQMCVDILIVDAFVRCKIFKNPEGYKYVTTR